MKRTIESKVSKGKPIFLRGCDWEEKNGESYSYIEYEAYKCFICLLSFSFKVLELSLEFFSV